MKPLKKIYPIMLLLSFCISIFLKTDITKPHSLNIEIQTLLEGPSLRLIKKVRPVNRGNFQIEFYRPQSCDGFIALIKLNKNEEGAAILAHYLKKPLKEISFIHNAHVYDHFPAIRYWFNSIFHSSSRHVIAVKEYGNCKLIKKIDWSLI